MKDLRASLGLVNFVAGRVVYGRAVLTWLWMAVQARSDEALRPKARPAQCRKALAADRLHTRRLVKPLAWLDAFLSGKEGAIVRRLPLVPPPAPLRRITCDASPWGIGAVLHIGGIAAEWIAEPLTPFNESLFGAEIGVSDYISVWEALALLVALRTWGAQGDGRVELRTDSSCAIASLAGLRTKSPPILRVALELNLDLAESRYEVSEMFHIPGVTNVEADALSRLFAPTALDFPATLEGTPRAATADRSAAEFWRSSSTRASSPRPRVGSFRARAR